MKKTRFKYIVRFYILVSLVSLFLGCRTARPKEFRGYSNTRLAEDVFQVSVNGSYFGNYSSERAFDFCLLGAADLTIKNGFGYFIIVKSEKDNNYYYSNGYLGTKPSTSVIIQCFKNNIDNDAVVFDAQFISKSIREKYGIKEN